MTKHRMTSDNCLWCGESLWFEGSRIGLVFCSRKCENVEYYRRKGIPIHRQRYKKSKQRWKVSKLGVSMNVWWNKLRDYR